MTIRQEVIDKALSDSLAIDCHKTATTHRHPIDHFGGQLKVKLVPTIAMTFRVLVRRQGLQKGRCCRRQSLG